MCTKIPMWGWHMVLDVWKEGSFFVIHVVMSGIMRIALYFNVSDYSKRKFNFQPSWFRCLRGAFRKREENVDYTSWRPRSKTYMDNFQPAKAIDLLVGGTCLFNLEDLYHFAGSEDRLVYDPDGRIMRCTLLVRPSKTSRRHGYLCQQMPYRVVVQSLSANDF